MKKIVSFALILVFVLGFATIASAQTGTTGPTVALPPIPPPFPGRPAVFSGILREDNGWVSLFFKMPEGRTETRIVLCNQVLDGGYCTPTYEFRASDQNVPSVNRGNLMAASIPIVLGYGQYVTAYEIRGGSVEKLTSLNLDAGDNPGIVIAAYEQQISGGIPQTQGPMTTGTPTSLKTALKIIGNFDPSVATVYTGYEQIKIEVISIIQQPNSSMKETTILLEDSVIDRLGYTYPLSIQQYGANQTVTVKRTRFGSNNQPKG